MAFPAFHPVILCGGAGSRLWPTSTPERPKAFLSLTGPRSLLQETALRVASGAAVPIVVASSAHAALARQQLADVGLACAIVSEPGGRGSAPAVAVAALEIFGRDPDGLAVVVACDHHVPDAGAFMAGVEAALPAAAGGAIVTFGVKPTEPTGAYGYILPGAPLAWAVCAAARFIEKPSPEDAAALVAAGWLWNSGNFVFHAGAMLEELALLEPALLAAARAARDEAVRDGDDLRLGQAFLSAPVVALDVAVMEKTSRAAVLPVDYAWSDLGAWDAVLEAAVKDASGNAVDGRAVVIDSERCLIRGDGAARIVAIGLRDIAVVVEGGRVLVCDLAAAQEVRSAATGVEQP